MKVESKTDLLVDLATAEFATVAEGELRDMAERIAAGASAGKLAFSIAFARTEDGDVEIKTSSGVTIKLASSLRKARIDGDQLSLL